MSPASHPNSFLVGNHGSAMSASLALSDAWTLLKDFSFLNHLPEEYYNNLFDRMERAIERREPLQYVNARPSEHYEEQKAKRYHEGQAVPRQFQRRSRHKFTIEDIVNFMAEDLAHSHPELLEAMREEKPASDTRLPDRQPSMMFDAFVTDNPKPHEVSGLSHRFSPHFHLDEEGKLQLNTVGPGKLEDRSRQTIQVVPSTSPLPTDVHDNSAIHEDLPNRFDFMERGVPEEMNEGGPLPETFSPPEKDYSHLPEAFREMARARDAKNASEPMEVAWRLLKAIL